MMSTPCKMCLRQISPRIFLKMSFFSLYVQNLFFRRTLMILKIDTRLGSEIKSLSTHGGTVNSCTALTPSRQKYSNLAVCLSPVSDPSLVSIFKIMSVRRKKGFWTWSEKKLIFRKMRGDIWRRHILQGVDIIEVYLWRKKSAMGWIFWPQTALE